MIEAMFDAHGIDPKLHKVLIEEVPRVGRLEQVVGVEREVEGLVAVFLEARRHELRRSRHRAVAFVLFNVVEAVTHAAVLAELDPVRTAEIAEEMSDILLRYLERSPLLTLRPDLASRLRDKCCAVAFRTYAPALWTCSPRTSGQTGRTRWWLFPADTRHCRRSSHCCTCFDRKACRSRTSYSRSCPTNFQNCSIRWNCRSSTSRRRRRLAGSPRWRHRRRRWSPSERRPSPPHRTSWMN
jgi:hypothetical protein